LAKTKWYCLFYDPCVVYGPHYAYLLTCELIMIIHV
jgi:hypothetical protein